MILPISIMFTHFIGDFLLQSDWMATHKSKQLSALALHYFLYSMCFLWWGSTFVIVTFGLHLVTDALTSQITAHFFRTGQRHWFFVVIGADQLIHYTTLAITLRVFV